MKLLRKHKGKEHLVGITDDPNDPDLTHGVNHAPVPQATKYLVLSDDERAKGFIRPVRTAYIHTVCGNLTTMGQAIAETYARDPHFYGATYCVACQMHRPVGPDGEFVWCDRNHDPTNDKVGT